MSALSLKKTLNLHKYSVRVSDFVLNWKIIVPVIFSVAGLIIGSTVSEGEGRLYLKITEYFTQSVMNQPLAQLVPYFLRCLLIPSVLLALLFFFGLSAYGGIFTNFFPFAYGFVIGVISFYMYRTYTLKGLAYCVIMIFPYAVLSMIAIILCTAESISMSELILRSISKSKKFIDYSFKTYYTQYAKNYAFVLLAAAIKIILDYLFGTLFNF